MRDFCAGVFIDLSKAFDNWSYNTSYKITGITIDWLKNYLTNKVQFVSIENVTSSNGRITCGVLQGSIISNIHKLYLLLIICVEFYFVCRWYKLILFIKSISELKRVLNHEMTALSEWFTWFTANRLSLNIDKTSYILFCASNARRVPEPSFELFIESIKVKHVESCKFIRSILACKYRKHTSNYFKELQVLKFPDNFFQTALFYLFMFKVDRILLPSHFFIKIVKSITIASYYPTSIT